MNDALSPIDPANCEHVAYLWDSEIGDYYCPDCKTHFDQSAVPENPVVKDPLTTRPSAQEQFPYRENCPQMSNYCDKHLRGYAIGSPWYGVIEEAFSIEQQLTAAKAALKLIATESPGDWGIDIGGSKAIARAALKP